MSEFTDGMAKFVVTKSFGILSGTVTAFSGTFRDGYPIDKNTGLVNKEWHLCDGTNGTPDLRNRFIYGGDGTNSGATGGEATHKLTVDEMPYHDHESPDNAAGYFAGWGSKNEDGWVAQSAKRTDGENWRTKSTGGGQPHNNMPPYYVLAWIMKL